MNQLYKQLESELMNYIIFGPPGSGKGTYASLLEEKLGIVKISTGDMVREEIKKGTELGLKMKEYYDKGELVPDEIIIKMLKDKISQVVQEGKSYGLDGFPRTVEQAKALEKFAKIDVVINLKVPDWVIVERLSTRRICKKCGAIYNIKYLKPKVEGVCDKCGGELIQREDDKPEVIKERIRVYYEKIKPTLDYLLERVPFIEVGCDSPEISPEVMVDKIIEKLEERNFI